MEPLLNSSVEAFAKYLREVVKAGRSRRRPEPNVWPELDHHPHEVVEVCQAGNSPSIVVTVRFDKILRPEA